MTDPPSRRVAERAREATEDTKPPECWPWSSVNQVRPWFRGSVFQKRSCLHCGITKSR